MPACNRKLKETERKTSAADENKQFERATVNGQQWQSEADEIPAACSDFEDRLQIFTKYAAGKTNVLLTAQPFGITGAGKYNSVKENAFGYGVSLIDDNSTDNDVPDYDNFRQVATANCVIINTIKETADGKLITGTFKSSLNESNNYNASQSKPVNIDGSFAVMLKK